MTAFKIEERRIDGILNVFVQGRFWFGWAVIKTFHANSDAEDDEWWARACAQNLLDELNKEQ